MDFEKRNRSRREKTRRHVLAAVSRWTPTRKAELCMALKGGVVSLEEVLKAHQLGTDELADWQRAFQNGGADGLYIGRRPMRGAA